MKKTPFSWWPLLGRTVVRLGARLVLRPLLEWKDPVVIAVTGSAGKTSVARLLYRIYLEAGYRAAAATTDGVLVNGGWVARGDAAGPKGLWDAVRGYDLDVVVAETARGGLLNFGAGFRRCDAGVVTNIRDDHLGHLGIQTRAEMAGVKGEVIRRVRRDGVAVLNRDDPLVQSMQDLTPARVLWFGLNEDARDIRDGCTEREGRIVFRRAGAEQVLVSADELPLLQAGACPYNLPNVLAALCAVEGLQARLPVTSPVLVRTLKTFGAAPLDQYGRATLFRYRGRWILLTLSKDAEGYRHTLGLARRVMAGRGLTKLAMVVTPTLWKRSGGHEASARLLAGGVDLVHLRILEPLSMRGALVSLEEMRAIYRDGLAGVKLVESSHEDLEPCLEELDRETDNESLIVIADSLQLKRADFARLQREGQVAALAAEPAHLLEHADARLGE